MARISPFVFKQEFDNNGAPLAGGKLYTYEAGTSTPKATYTDSTEGTANANPIILDANGRYDLWLGAGAYKFILHDANDVLISTVDDIEGDASNVSTYEISTTTNIDSTYANGIILCTSSPTINLLAASSAGDGFYIDIKNTGVGVVTIDPASSETIDSAATLTIGAGVSARIYCDATNWYSIFNTQVNGAAADNQKLIGVKSGGGLETKNNVRSDGTYLSIGGIDASSDAVCVIRGNDTSCLQLEGKDTDSQEIFSCVYDATGTPVDRYKITIGNGFATSDVTGNWFLSTNGSTRFILQSTGGLYYAAGAPQEAGSVNATNLYVNGTNIDNRNPSAQAWVNFTGTGTVTINDSYNVTSITDDGTGAYTVNLSITMASVNYCPVVSLYDDSQTNLTADFGNANRNSSFTTTTFRINTSQGISAVDADRIYCIVYGDRA